MISLERRDGRPLRIGHRGAAALAPENTLRSFRAALAAGVDLIELDVLRLRGGELVIAHSNDLREVSHGAARGRVRDLALRDLLEICPELPTLEEALRFFVDEAPGVGVHVDLKSASAASEVAAALDRLGLVERAFFSSFDQGALKQLASLEPRVLSGISFPRDRLGVSGRRRLERGMRGGLRALRAATPQLVPTLLRRSGAGALVLRHELVTTAAVERAHERGAAVVAWTVDDPGDLARVVGAGADAVVTNDPAIFASTLQP